MMFKKKNATTGANLHTDDWVREAVEAIAIAIMLAFLFRAFEAEAFVIPTGSMAPTLQGRHKDVECPQCGYWYQAGASSEAETNPQMGRVMLVGTTCPMCRYTQQIRLRGDRSGRILGPADSAHKSFTGDRILVDKFAYVLADPERWDVIVFKFPGNAKQNFIKRLVGLPNEMVQIGHGDVYTRPLHDESAPLLIARKPPRKLVAMLQLVHDTSYTPRSLVEANWPSRWSPASTDDEAWSTELVEGESDQAQAYRFRCLAEGEQTEWLRYQHLVPSHGDWGRVETGSPIDPSTIQPRLIDDFYAYNAFLISRISDLRLEGTEAVPTSPYMSPSDLGMHWVGDLALEAELEVASDQGVVSFELIEGGHRYTCQIDIADGTAKLMIDQGEGRFLSADDQPGPAELTASTSLKGKGTYEVRMTNCDHQVLLWVNNKVVTWNHNVDAPGSYPQQESLAPQWTAEDPLDLAPLRIGVKQAELTVSRMRVLRDVYYVARSGRTALMDDYQDWTPTSDTFPGEHGSESRAQEIRRILKTPSLWEEDSLFEHRRWIEIDIEEEEYFPMGDNSPRSQDGRAWNWIDPPHVVPRRLLAGKAFMVYWPHPWSVSLPGGRAFSLLPNFKRMQRIR